MWVMRRETIGVRHGSEVTNVTPLWLIFSRWVDEVASAQIPIYGLKGRSKYEVMSAWM
jgi:hypothetical protein